MIETDPIADPVSDIVPGAREIGFSLPRRYNAASILLDNLRHHAARPALRGPAGTVTYAQLCRDASRATAALQSLGLGRGDRVVLLLDDTPAYPAFFFGAMSAGLVPVLVNTLSPPDLLQFYLQDADARAMVIDADLVALLGPALVRDAGLQAVVVTNGSTELPHVPRVLQAAALATFPGEIAAAETDRDDMAFWMYSSGSTGRPKAVVHLHHDMAYTVASYATHVLKLRAEDVCFSVPKIFFAYGLGNSLSFPIAAGASSVLLPGKPEPGAIFQAIAAHRPTVFFGLPTLYTALAKSSAALGADTSSLRLCISAAEILSNEVSGAWKKLTGLEIVEGLGSTEMLHIYLSNTEAKKRAGSAGLRVPGYEVRLADADGHETGDGEEGIIWVRGQSSAPLYWNRPDKTAETMRGDWLYTGDRFVRDAEGFYFFRGRSDELIKVSGQWVYPLEVELCLAEHAAVREVAVAAVELPDRRMALKAFVVPAEEGADPAALTRTLQEFVKERLLPHKYPRLVEFLPELPKTGTGKIDRQALLRSTGR
jgi:benzoate-CoA ligase family protein